ncbi:CGL17 [Auxenochlorella protothecoides x Auxenochlorella symbiontica]
MEPPRRTEYDIPPQLQKSRDLNSEGLSGLPKRASELLNLGISFTLAFTPFLLIGLVAFGAIYAVFGTSFVHGGGSHLPPRVDPEQLLRERTQEPFVFYH